MRVALIGGTGFVGGYLTDALVAAGHEPVLLVREGSESKVRQRDVHLPSLARESTPPGRNCHEIHLTNRF